MNNDLISREAAVAVCSAEYKECLRKSDWSGDTVAWNIGFQLKQLPAVDAVEVVRCKDCKFSQSCVNGHGENIFNCRNGDCGFYGWGMMETDFCSYGEREKE